MHSCVKPNNNYQTNIKSSPNLIYGGKPKNEWQTIYDRNIQDYPSIADCPEKKPYFDGILCISCPDERPYFNLEYKTCQQCQKGSKYDADIHQCLSEEGNIIKQAPNIEKMAASIFAWSYLSIVINISQIIHSFSASISPPIYSLYNLPFADIFTLSLHPGNWILGIWNASSGQKVQITLPMPFSQSDVSSAKEFSKNGKSIACELPLDFGHSWNQKEKNITTNFAVDQVSDSNRNTIKLRMP